MVLKVAPCTHEAAAHAVTHWHYSRAMPHGKLVKLGVWEDGTFIGAVVFGRGANNNLARPYSLDQTQVVELVRVALRAHTCPVSQVVAASLKVLKALNPGLRLVVSYADPDQGHHGGIYQAGNWVYAGRTKASAHLLIGGRPTHKRSADARWGTNRADKLTELTGMPVTWGVPVWKHLYLYPLDKQVRRKVTRLAQPYPPATQRAVKGSVVSRSDSV